MLTGSAFAVAVQSGNQPFISATRYGSGRVVHMGHEAMLGASSGSVFQLLQNAAAWLGSSAAAPIKLGATSNTIDVANRLANVSATQ